MRSGLSQTEVATALGTTQNYVSKSETGQRRMDPLELADFAALYRTTLAALVPVDQAVRADRSRKVAEGTVRPKRARKRRDKS